MKTFGRYFRFTLPVTVLLVVVAIANDLLGSDTPRLQLDSVLDVLKLVFGSLLTIGVAASVLAAFIALIGSHMPADHND